MPNPMRTPPPLPSRFDGTNSQDEVDAEKAAKPRVDLYPGSALIAGGAVQAYGKYKHGNCTWKEEGTEQADPQSHIASAMRHMAEYLDNPDALEKGSNLPVLWHAQNQIAIAIDCQKNLDPEAFYERMNSLPETLRQLEKKE